MENVRKQRDIKILTPERRAIYLVSEPIYGTSNFILKKMLSAEIDIKDILVNKSLSVLQFSKE